MFLKNKFYIIFTIIILGCANIFAQTSGFSINGKVTDANGAVLSNADVSLANTVSGKTVNTQTDANGNFNFSSLSGGNYKIIVNTQGFSSAAKDLVIDSNNIENADVILSVGNISEQVTVTATRTQVATIDTAVPVSVINRQEIERKNLNTIGDVFRYLPGTSTTNEGSFQVRPVIRGLDSNRVLILVDGERLNNGRTSTGLSGIEIGLVGTEQIETVEVLRGSGSVLYGTDALGGTINIITKDAPRNLDDGFHFGGTFNGFFSSNETGRRGSLALTGSSKFFSFRVAQSLERYENYFTGDLDGQIIDGVSADGEVLNSQSHGSNTQLTTRFFFNDDNDLRLNYERRRVGNIGVPTLVGVFTAYFPFSDRDKFNARYESRNLNKYLARLSGSFYFQKQKRDFTNILNVPAAPPFFPGVFQFSETVTDTDSIGFDVQSNWLLGTKNVLTAGFSFFRDKNTDERFVETLSPNFRTFPPSLTRTTTNSPSVPNANFGSFAVFAQDQFEVTNRLQLTGGIRAERFFSNSSPTNNFVLPAQLSQQRIQELGLDGLEVGLNTNQTAVTGDFGIVYRLTDKLSLTGRIGRSFRVPNLFERFFTGSGSIGGLVVGNPNLEPESGVNFDTGVKFRNSKFAGSVTYFNNTYRNFLSNILIDPTIAAPVGLFQTQNIGRARIQGFEADAEFPIKIGLGFLTPSGNISYLHGDDLGANQPLDFITPLKTVLNIRWTNLNSNYYTEWTTRIVNKQDRLSPTFLAENLGAEPGFVVSDIGGGYIYRRENYRLSFNVGIKNIFDRFYNEQFVLAPARGRSFVAGTTLSFN
ncbi:MAG: TonB-dependent receptor [Aridibacter sp.]